MAQTVHISASLIVWQLFFVSFMVQITDCFIFIIIFFSFCDTISQGEREIWISLPHWNCWHVVNGQNTQSLQSNVWRYFILSCWLTESRLNWLHNISSVSLSVCGYRKGFFLLLKIELFESNLHNKCNCVCTKFHTLNF